jgi:Limiting CO2-inducible proteins B/C beta carbonyic anhydrases
MFLLLEHYLYTQTLGKVAGAVGTIALATGGAPEIALATRRGVRTTKTVVQVVETVDKTNRLVATAVVGATLACVIGKRLVDTFMRGVDTKATEDKIAEAFPGSLKNKDLVVRVKQALRKYDYGSDSLLVTSLDPDEINLLLEKDFGYAFKENYNMGGLAGFPFGGVRTRIDQDTAAVADRRRHFFG